MAMPNSKSSPPASPHTDDRQGRALAAYLLGGELDQLEDKLKAWMLESSTNEPDTMFRFLINECGDKRLASTASWCISVMLKWGILPDTGVFNAAIHASARVGDTELASGLYGKMRSHFVQPDKTTYNTLIAACSNARRSSEALRWFEHMQSEHLQASFATYAWLIAAFGREGNIAEAEEWCSRMVKDGFEADLRIYNSLVNACAHGGSVDRAKFWYEQILITGLTPDSQTYNRLIRANACVGDLAGAESWMEAMMRANYKADRKSFTSLLHACAVSGPKRAKHWMEVMINSGLSPDALCFEAVLRACSLTKDYANATKWFSMMESAGFQLQCGCFEHIIEAHAWAGKLSAAEVWLNRMTKAGFPVSSKVQQALLFAIKQTGSYKGLHDSSQAIALCHMMIIKAYARAFQLDLIQNHVLGMGDISKMLFSCSEFQQELWNEMCSSSGGEPYAAELFDVLGLPFVRPPMGGQIGGSQMVRTLPPPPGCFLVSSTECARINRFSTTPSSVKSRCFASWEGYYTTLIGSVASSSSTAVSELSECEKEILEMFDGDEGLCIYL